MNMDGFDVHLLFRFGFLGLFPQCFTHTLREQLGIPLLFCHGPPSRRNAWVAISGFVPKKGATDLRVCRSFLREADE